MLSVRTKVAASSLSKDSWANLVIFISVLIYKYAIIMKYASNQDLS